MVADENEEVRQMHGSDDKNGGAPAIRVEGLTKRYGSRDVVDHLSIEVPRGVIAGFVGPNGAGKTTTLRMLLGLVRPTSGTGSVLGRSIDDPASYLARVGGLVEGPAFHPALSGRRNLEVLAALGGHDAGEITKLLDEVGLGSRGDDSYNSYSLGMKQRLGIAGALIGSPELLILDEPTNGLDPAGIREMRGFVARLARADRTIFVSSHLLAEVEQVCDWLVMIDEGKLVYQGSTVELLTSTVTSIVVAPQHRRDLDRLRNALATDGYSIGAHEDRLTIDADGADPIELAADVNRRAMESGIVLVELHPQRARLEDRYLSMVGGNDA
jgi:ABC-2 type transport system ATP-binding protein